MMLDTIKKPLRYVKKRLFAERRDSEQRATSILDLYSTKPPSDQEAINIFAGEWASQFPADKQLTAGAMPLFEDSRIALGVQELGGVAGQKVLELGPLEGGHSYLLEKAGAQSVLAIEGNTRAYLKCLIAKEVLGLQRVRFLCGDFLEYLRQSPPHFDFALCSGVLYHQKQPVELLHRLSQITDRLLIWTHYYDEEIISSSPLLSPRFEGIITSEYAGFRHILHRQFYQEALKRLQFCGAGAEDSCWMERDELLGALRHLGFQTVKVLQEDRHFVNGPCFMLTATR